MDDEERKKRQLKRAARRIQKETGMKYTAALRLAKEKSNEGEGTNSDLI